MVGAQGARTVEHDKPYDVGRILFHAGFLMTLGTCYAFSTWSGLWIMRAGSPGPFPDWTIVDLNFIYSLGTIGTFATPVGGLIYDTCGSSQTFLAGLVLFALGNLGTVLATLLLPSMAPRLARYVVAACYYLQEQGGSTLFMAVLMDSLIHFPAKHAYLSMGIVSTGFGLSSVITSFIMGRVNIGIVEFLLGVLSSVVLFSLVRLCVLGDVSSTEGVTTTTTTSRRKAGQRKAQIMPAFRVLMLGSFANSSAALAFIGSLKPLGSAFQLDGARLAQAFLLANCGSRFATGWLCNLCSWVPSTATFFLSLAGTSLAFLLVTLHALLLLQFGPETPAPVLLVAGCLLLALSFGANVCIRGVFVKDHFPTKISGRIYGLSELTVALGSFLLIGLFGPEADDAGSFARPILASTCSSFVALVLVVPDLMLVQRWPPASPS